MILFIQEVMKRALNERIDGKQKKLIVSPLILMPLTEKITEMRQIQMKIFRNFEIFSEPFVRLYQLS